MNLIESIVLHKYIYSPKNWLHNLKPHHKTYYLFMYLCIIQYSHFKYIAISVCLYLILVLYFKNINNNYIKILLYTLCILYILVYIIFLLKKSQFQTCITIISHIHYTIIYIYNKYILYLRILLLLIQYFLGINIIFMTTTYEDIIFSFLKLFKQHDNNKINNIIFISIFASQALESIGIKIKNILLSIKMKKITKLFRIKYYIYLTLKLIQDMYSDIYRISTVLYTRELNKSLLYITDIHK
uniref:Cobalt transport protein n=1 Tax=Gracilaria hainanensis TaxID=2871843 RepID=A0AAU7YPQ6_9FLOR